MFTLSPPVLLLRKLLICSMLNQKYKDFVAILKMFVIWQATRRKAQTRCAVMTDT